MLNVFFYEYTIKDYTPEEFDLAVELNQIINSNKRLYIYSNVYPKVINECGENVSTKVLSDRKWNCHMIEQLISNAVKYSAEEGAVKNVMFRLTKEGKKTVLYVEDEGIGIVLYFKQFSEIEEMKKTFMQICKIGITRKEISRIISKELLIIFYLPLLFGSYMGVSLIYLMTFIVGGGDIIKQFVQTASVVIGIYFILQSIFFFVTRKRYMVELTN